MSLSMQWPRSNGLMRYSRRLVF